jgi:hypothetical protein
MVLKTPTNQKCIAQKEQVEFSVDLCRFSNPKNAAPGGYHYSMDSRTLQGKEKIAVSFENNGDTMNFSFCRKPSIPSSIRSYRNYLAGASGSWVLKLEE